MKPTFTLEQSVGYIINKTAMKLKSELLNGFKVHGFDVTTEQWAVLVCLRAKDGRTQKEIAEVLIKDKTNLSRILDGMEKKDLIERRSHETDRRSYRILITKKGKMLVEKLIPIAHRINTRVVQGLSKEDMRELERLLKTLYGNLE